MATLAVLRIGPAAADGRRTAALVLVPGTRPPSSSRRPDPRRAAGGERRTPRSRWQPDLPAPRSHRVTLSPGSTLLVYTDGLIENRTCAYDERLAQLLAAAATRRGAVAEAGAMTACSTGCSCRWGTSEPGDDLAIMAVEVREVR